MTTKTKLLTIDRTEFNKQNYDNITEQIIDKEQVIPFNSVILKVLYHMLADVNVEV